MNRLFENPARCVILFCGVALCGTATADDGQIEINQLCVSTGCFAGDYPGGFPIEINNPGSYVLTSDLVVPEGDSGIRVFADNVRLDLAGHTVSGPVSCTGDGPKCTPATTGFGITGGAEGLAVINGVVKGFGNNCLGFSGEGLLLRDLTVSNCQNDGINSVAAGIVESVLVFNNGGIGAFLEPDIIVRDSVFKNNGARGIWLGICSGNLLLSNGDVAQTPQEDCTVDDGSNVCGISPCP